MRRITAICHETRQSVHPYACDFASSTGCIDVSDNADAQDSSDSEEAETTVINNYYNNTTTVVQAVEPEMVHMYVYTENQSVGSITIGENQTIEWLWSSSIVDYGNGDGFVMTPFKLLASPALIPMLDISEEPPQGLLSREKVNAPIHLPRTMAPASLSTHHSLTYLIHEL